MFCSVIQKLVQLFHMSVFRVCIPGRPGIPDIFHSRIAGNETDTIPGNENSPGRDTNHSNRGIPSIFESNGIFENLKCHSGHQWRIQEGIGVD